MARSPNDLPLIRIPRPVAPLQEGFVTTYEATARALGLLERSPHLADSLLAPLRLMTRLQVRRRSAPTAHCTALCAVLKRGSGRGGQVQAGARGAGVGLQVADKKDRRVTGCVGSVLIMIVQGAPEWRPLPLGLGWLPS